MYFKNNESRKRYSIFPIIHQDLWDKYKAAEKQTWVAEEIDLSKDDFQSLPPEEKLALKNVLAFFNISDALVIDNIAANFLNQVDILEAQYYYGHQVFIEQVHSNFYSLMTERYIPNQKEKEEMFFSMESNPTVAKKAQWAEKWMQHPSISHNLVAFACVEGILFSSLFAIVFYFRSRGKMPGMCAGNELVINEETGHYEFGVSMYNKYLKDEYKLPKEEVEQIIMEAYEVEKTFVESSLPEGLSGLTKEMMIQYVQFVVDTVLRDFGIEPKFSVPNPLNYMARLGLSNKNNFFEQRVGAYTRVDIPETIKFDDNF